MTEDEIAEGERVLAAVHAKAIAEMRKHSSNTIVSEKLCIEFQESHLRTASKPAMECVKEITRAERHIKFHQGQVDALDALLAAARDARRYREALEEAERRYSEDDHMSVRLIIEAALSEGE